jgi:signal transduction histidine kinase
VPDSRVRRLLQVIPERPTIDQAQAGLREALDDPTLVLGLWDGARYVGCDGLPLELPDGDDGRVTTVLGYDEPLAALVHDAAALDSGEVFEAVVATARMGLAKDRLQDELEAKIAELEASRARIVEAHHDERRRLERNLHDGAQQRLVTLSLTLRLAEARAHEEPAAVPELLASARAELAEALSELRELARGIHPATLTDGGLKPALEGAASRAPLPVRLEVALERRLPEAIEIAAYYVVSEALTNAVKHASANEIEVVVVRSNGTAVIEVRDDGAGGADGAGSGLRGLADRVAALGGALSLDSPPGAGTTLRAQIPLH